MLGKLISLPAFVAGVYLLLLAVYFASCTVIERLNRPIAAAKIQARQTAPELVRRDRRQSTLSLFGIAVMFGAGQWAYIVLGLGFRAPLSVTGTVLSLAASLVLFDAWFYWFHRLIHARPFYAWVHRWHHLTVTPVGWSNNSDRLIDNLFLQSYWLLAHLLIPIAPWALLAHKLYDQVTGVIGHSGYEHGGRWCRPPSPLVGVTHHDQHHRFFRCNYATHFTWWDRLMGTLHPDHDAELRRNLAATATARRGPGAAGSAAMSQKP